MNKFTALPLAALACFSPLDQKPPGPELMAAYQQESDFACDLHRDLVGRADGANVFFSPNSIAAALAMVAEGARGETAVEFARVLQGADELDLAALHALREDLHRRLAAPGEGASGVQWSEANGIWADAGAKLVAATQEALQLHYGARVQPADFRGAADAVRLEINRWVEERTHDRIQDLLPSGSVNEMTRLVLVNAVYFLGKWEDEFEKAKTTDRPFTLPGGIEITVPFLQDSREMLAAFYSADDERLSAGESPALSVFELPYSGGKFSFVGLVPASEDGLPELESRMSARLLKLWIDGLRSQRVQFSMPKLKLEPSYDLVPTLKGLGLGRVLDPATADLSGFFGEGGEELHVTGAFHKAFLEVDEAGTEAAAATGVVVGVRSAPLRVPRISADRPYLFLIRERTTGAILFMGRITNPVR